MSIPPLPTEWQIERAKLVEYLLHPVNSRGKWVHFHRYGFSQANWMALFDALLVHAQSHPWREKPRGFSPGLRARTAQAS